VIDRCAPPATTTSLGGRIAIKTNIEATIATVCQNNLYRGSCKRRLAPKRETNPVQSAEVCFGLVRDRPAEGMGEELL
jgi:hypothetical protein